MCPIGAKNQLARGTAQCVVSCAEVVAASIPGANAFCSCVVQYPALCGLHARLVDAVPKHVKVEGHDDAALLVSRLDDRIANGAPISLDVEIDAGWKRVAATVVRDGEEGSA